MPQWVIGNWKLHGSRQLLTEVATAVADAGFGRHVALCVPYIYLDLACQLTQSSAVQIGSQDVSQYDRGAYTGEVSAQMVADIGGELALIGHSERRMYFAESAAMLQNKLKYAMAAGLYCIVCVGEALAARQSGQAVEYVLSQLNELGPVAWENMAIAYEPVWAIGTGLIPTPEQIRQMHTAIKAYTKTAVPVLYGGSVRATNAAEILAIEGVDGLLVGGASLQADEFIAIGRCARAG